MVTYNGITLCSQPQEAKGGGSRILGQLGSNNKI